MTAVAYPASSPAYQGDVRTLVQFADAASHSVTGTTDETALFTYTLPPGIVGPYSWLEIRPVWSYTNSANNKVLRVRLGASMSATETWVRTRTTSEAEAPHIVIASRGALNSQVEIYNAVGDATTAAGAAPQTRTYDFSVANTLYFTGDLASAAETITLEALRIAVWSPGRMAP